MSLLSPLEHRYAVRINFSTTFEHSLSSDYDIIFNQIRFGGIEKRNLDEKIAIKNQLIADETLGIVGMSNAIRAITGITPYFEMLSGKKNRYHLINFTNPCSIITQYAVASFGLNMIGVCDYPLGLKNAIANYMGIDQTKLTIDYFGLNHIASVWDIYLDGKSIYADFVKHNQETPFRPKAKDQSLFPALMIPNWDIIFNPEIIIGKQNKQSINRAQLLVDIEHEFYKNMDNKRPSIFQVPPILRKRSSDWYLLAVVPLIKNILDSSGNHILNVSLKSDPFALGTKDTIVETNVSFAGGTFEIKDYSAKIGIDERTYPHLRQLKKAELLLLQGILAKDKDIIMEAGVINPMIKAQNKIHSYFSELKMSDELFRQIF